MPSRTCHQPPAYWGGGCRHRAGRCSVGYFLPQDLHGSPVNRKTSIWPVTFLFYLPSKLWQQPFKHSAYEKAPHPHKFRVDGETILYHSPDDEHVSSFLFLIFLSLTFWACFTIRVFSLPTWNMSWAPHRPPQYSRGEDMGCFLYFFNSLHNAVYRALEMEIVKTGNNPVKVLRPGSWKCHRAELQGMENSSLFLHGERMLWESGQQHTICLHDTLILRAEL